MIPADYVCADCGAEGVKLWRPYQSTTAHDAPTRGEAVSYHVFTTSPDGPAHRGAHEDKQDARAVLKGARAVTSSRAHEGSRFESASGHRGRG